MFKTFYNVFQNRTDQKSDRGVITGKVFFIFGLLLLLMVFAPLALAQESVLNAAPRTFEVTRGWYQGRPTYYYDFGANTGATEDRLGVVPAPIYVLVTGFDAEGNPQVVAGQNNIVDVLPGDPGYSDLWQVTFVTTPQDYVANTITSAEQILNGGYELTVPGMFVNCPIAPAGSILAEGGDLVQGWYRGQEVFYFDFGLNSETTAPIYAFVTGFNENDEPIFVEGQYNIIDVIPGDEGYSAFWNVNLVVVPEDYQANMITSAAEVQASGYEIREAGLLVNCPVVRTAEVDSPEAMAEGGQAMAEESAPAESPAQLPTTGGERSDLPLWSALFGGVALIGAGLFLLARNVGKGQLS